jgi:hypothetical protein
MEYRTQYKILQHIKRSEALMVMNVKLTLCINMFLFAVYLNLFHEHCTLLNM